MDLDEFDLALRRVEVVDLVGPVDSDSVGVAAKNLNITLPAQYRAFIERFGSGGVGSESIIGLGGPNHLNFEVMAKMLRARHPETFPETIIPIRNDGYGNYDCIDLQAVNDAGENPIVEWSHESGRGRRLADDFSKWLDNLMTLVYEDQ
jgi:hypothetical protein